MQKSTKEKPAKICKSPLLIEALEGVAIDCNYADSLSVHWVGDENGLYDLIDIIDTLPRVALDTEFIRRTTYHPILALVQVNTGDAIYLIDAPKLDLNDFWQALIEVPQMVWYASGEDLIIFYELAKCPPLTNVVDAQIMVAHLTGVASMSYLSAIKGVGRTLDKGESQSDWLKRPLTNHQERYAADDVRYLLVLADACAQALVQKNLLNFALEDGVHYARTVHEMVHMDDNLRYLDHVAPYYDAKMLAVLQSLCAWREEMARTMNEPRTYLINKASLRALVEQQPTYLGGLNHAGLHPQTVRKYGKDILALIKNAVATPLQLPPRLSEAQAQTLQDAIKDFAQSMGAQPEFAVKSRAVLSFAQSYLHDSSTPIPPELQGVRKAWCETVLLPLLHTMRTTQD